MIITTEAEKTLGSVSQRCINASFMSLNDYIDSYQPVLNEQPFNVINYSGCLTSGESMMFDAPLYEQDVFGTPGDGCLYCIGHIDMTGKVTIGDLSKVHACSDCSYSFTKTRTSFTFPYYNDPEVCRCSYVCWKSGIPVDDVSYTWYCDNCLLTYDVELNEVYDPKCLMSCCLVCGCHTCSDRCSVYRTISATTVEEAWNNGTLAIKCNVRWCNSNYGPPLGCIFHAYIARAYITDRCGIFMTRKRANECNYVIACTTSYCCLCKLNETCCYPYMTSNEDQVIAFMPVARGSDEVSKARITIDGTECNIIPLCKCCYGIRDSCFTVFNANEGAPMILAREYKGCEACLRRVSGYGYIYPWSAICNCTPMSYRCGAITCGIVCDSGDYHVHTTEDTYTKQCTDYECLSNGYCCASWNPNDAYYQAGYTGTTYCCGCYGNLSTVSLGCIRFDWCNECGIDYYVNIAKRMQGNVYSCQLPVKPNSCKIEACLTSVAGNCQKVSKLRYTDSGYQGFYVSYVDDVAYYKRMTTVYCVNEHWTNDVDLSSCVWCIYQEYV